MQHVAGKYICLAIHTEKLHDDGVFTAVENTLNYFGRHGIRATWFSINPTFVGYKAMGYDKEKWRERLKVIKDFGQEIQQHTHFYKGKEGVPKGEGYDMSGEHMRMRLTEDKRWLEDLGFHISGFVSGAWKINDDLFGELRRLGYNYDSSFKEGVLRHIHGIVEIPSSGNVKTMLIDFFKLKSDRFFLSYRDFKVHAVPFHDYDFISLKFRNALKLFILLYSFLGYKFVPLGDIHKEIRGKELNINERDIDSSKRP